MLVSQTPALPPTFETISWTTQIIPSYDGHEERHLVRQKPRYTYQSNAVLTSRTEVEAFKTRNSMIRDKVQFVLWHAFYNGSARLATVRGHPWYFEFDNLVATLPDGGVATVSNSVRGAGVIYPVLEGYVHGNMQYNIRQGSGNVQVSYNVEEAVTPPVQTNVPTIMVGGKSYELLEMPTKSGFQQAVTQNQSYFDSVVGKYISTTRWRRPKLQWSYTVELFSVADVLAWKQFLFRRQGRYMPVALRDINGRVVVMRLGTDTPKINHPLGYSTSTVPFMEVFV